MFAKFRELIRRRRRPAALDAALAIAAGGERGGAGSRPRVRRGRPALPRRRVRHPGEARNGKAEFEQAPERPFTVAQEQECSHGGDEVSNPHTRFAVKMGNGLNHRQLGGEVAAVQMTGCRRAGCRRIGCRCAKPRRRREQAEQPVEHQLACRNGNGQPRARQPFAGEGDAHHTGEGEAQKQACGARQWPSGELVRERRDENRDQRSRPSTGESCPPCHPLAPAFLSRLLHQV